MTDRHFQVQCRVLGAVWLLAVFVTSVQAILTHNNNFEVFRASSYNLLAGRDLYVANATHHDFFKYSPTFALLFTPFAVLPFGLGLLLWNAVNAGALWAALGRILDGRQAFIARLIVTMDLVGSMQNVQSNALSAGLMILAFADLNDRREARAATWITLGTIIKIFPIIAGVFAAFRPYRLPRFVLFAVVAAGVAVAAPLLVESPAALVAQYNSWKAISSTDALMRGFSVMELWHLASGTDWPNWPLQLAGVVVLLAPLVRYSFWGLTRFRLLFLASVLMFCVLFNHKAESPSFVVALAGIAIWFTVSERRLADWVLLGVVFVGTVLSSSDAMPKVWQESLFEPYRLKAVPVLLVWVVTQTALWRMTPGQSASAQPRAHRSAPAAGAI
ncbi:MAG TPA: glycosyltransferase family 87 protein [Gemmatimonadaceae bacterium]|nr:glycosyltransferase family 87 protein [Gemmatimonadaceae bacterium]